MELENGVVVSEVAKVLNSTSAAVTAEAKRLSIVVGLDWAGRPAISERDAAELFRRNKFVVTAR